MSPRLSTRAGGGEAGPGGQMEALGPSACPHALCQGAPKVALVTVLCRVKLRCIHMTQRTS